MLYPSQRWLELEEKLLALPRNRQTRFFVRSLAENVKAVCVDSQGRISIPAELAEKAGITGEIMFLGKFDTMELWHPERYREYIADTGFSCEEIAEDLDLPL